MHPPTSETAQRTGPYGRLARLLLAATAGLALASIVDQGGLAAFHGQSLRNEPGLALIAPVMAVVLVSLVGGVATELADDRSARRWRVATLGVLATAVAVAALIGAATGAGAWSSPLIDLVWTLDSLMLTETLIAALLAVVLGTPGCEVGVWPELVARARGRRSPPVTGIACVVGLHALDRWEARRRRVSVGDRDSHWAER